MKKIRHRLALTFTLIIGISVLVLGIYISQLIEEIYIDALGDRLDKEANMIKFFVLDEIHLNNSTKYLERISKEIGESISTRITIINTGGIVLADSEYNKDKMENHSDRPEVGTALIGQIGKEIRYSDTLDIEMLYIASPIYENNKIIGVIRLALPLQEIKSSLKTFWYNLMLALTIVFFITIIISGRVSNKITKPLEHMTQIARKIMKKNYSVRLDIKRHDEIGQLGTAINMMAESLEKQMTTIYENEEKLTTVLNNMTSGVILVDKEGTIILANPAIEWLVGGSLNQHVRKYHFEAGEQNKISELINRSLKTGESIQTEVGVYYPTRKYLNCNIAPIYDAKGNINGVLAVLHDIIKIKRLEKMRSEFVANVSHELRTPITAVKGFAETLLDGSVKDEETQKTFLQIIYDESDRLHRLISDLLDLSKIEQNDDILKYDLVNLKVLIKSTIETMKPQIDKRKLTIFEEISNISAEVDKDRIRQVIINLVINAIAYTPEKGSIFLRLDEINNYQIKIEVEDTGIGIPKKSLPRLFERFYRVDKARSRESGGTGLGLAIVKHIIESHSGTIHIDSEVGIGTKFTIALPKKRK